MNILGSSCKVPDIVIRF